MTDISDWFTAEPGQENVASVQVPVTGEFLVRDGNVMPVLESEMQDYVEGEVSYLVWVREDDG